MIKNFINPIQSFFLLIFILLPFYNSFAADRLIPDDQYYIERWQWQHTNINFGLRTPFAWDLVYPDGFAQEMDLERVTVAILSTGITNNDDLAGRILPGYDFITDVESSNDGDGRDPDATDSGPH